MIQHLFDMHYVLCLFTRAEGKVIILRSVVFLIQISYLFKKRALHAVKMEYIVAGI